MIGYTWVCDKCESYFNGRLDRLAWQEQAESQRCGESEGCGEPATDGAKSRSRRPVYR